MRQLLPTPSEIDPVEAHAVAHRPAPDGRPWFALNMVSSVDGATALDGVSGGLGGPADLAVFRAIRGVADVIIAAAGTVRAESYGPPRTPEPIQAARMVRGQSRHPRIAIVSRSLDLDERSALFTETTERPLVFTTGDAPDHRRRALEAVAEVHEAGRTTVSMSQVAATLGGMGVRCGVVEGGPTLNGHLALAGLIDEVNLSLSPLIAAGPSSRMATSETEMIERLDLAHLWEQDSMLFARYVRATGPAATD